MLRVHVARASACRRSRYQYQFAAALSEEGVELKIEPMFGACLDAQTPRQRNAAAAVAPARFTGCHGW